MKTASQLRLKDDQNTWNFLFSVLFVCILLIFLEILHAKLGNFPRSITFFDIALVTLASFRITRLVVYDKVTRFLREWFVKKSEVVVDGKPWLEITPYTHGFRATVYELLICPWCIGMWAALLTSFAYFAFTWTWYIILFLAIAGMASFIQILANLIGWKAENLKMDVATKTNGHF